MAEFADIYAFANLLNSVKGALSCRYKDLEARTGISRSQLTIWHTGGGFPVPADLLRVAEGYGIPVEEVRKAYEISKAGRELEKRARHGTRLKGDRFTPDRYGQIESRSRLTRCNPQLQKVWGGRS